MKITPDIIRYEFIGAKGLVAASPNMNLMGVGGLVVGETRNTFMFQNQGLTTQRNQRSCNFRFHFQRRNNR